MAERGDEWFAGAALLRRAIDIISDGRTPSLVVRGLEHTVIADEIEMDSFVATIRTTDSRRISLAIASIIAVEDLG